MPEHPVRVRVVGRKRSRGFGVARGARASSE
jgi:hypothetical protein